MVFASDAESPAAVGRLLCPAEKGHDGRNRTHGLRIPLVGFQISRTLKKLEEMCAKVREHGGMSVEPMQLAALLLEKTTEQLSADEAARPEKIRPQPPQSCEPHIKCVIR
jgi:hypothetical protein